MKTGKHVPCFLQSKSQSSQRRRKVGTASKPRPSSRMVLRLVKRIRELEKNLGDDPESYKDSCTQLLSLYQGLIADIARSLNATSSSVEVEDLFQVGYFGLMDAMRAYDETRGASFDTYASIRIKGIMLDALRKGGAIPKSVIRTTREVGNASAKLAHKIQREPSVAELKAVLPEDLAKKYETARLIRWQRTFASFSHSEGDSELDLMDAVPDGSIDLDERIDHARIMGAVRMVLSSLDKRRQEIMHLQYFVDEEDVLNQRQLGERFGVSESRISQIRAEIITHIQGYLQVCGLSR